MTGAIFLISSDGSLAELRPQGYLTEDELQALLASHPAVLAGGAGDRPLRFMLVRREAGIGDSIESGARWSVDHLFLDQEAVPTLVEVKRSTDTRIRREVVGQMLDYAANAVVYLPPDRIRQWFEARAEVEGRDATELLEEAFGMDTDPDAFWSAVASNVQAGRIRMLFVADAIPPELRRIVEFLNQQMDPAEVLAIEVVQFAGSGVRTLVPRTYGQTEVAKTKKSSRQTRAKGWDENEGLTAMEEVSPELGQLGKAVIAWATSLPSATFVRATRVPEIKPAVVVGGRKITLFALSNEGRIFLPFGEWNRVPQLVDSELRAKFAAAVQSATGVSLKTTERGWPRLDASLLFHESRRVQFLEAFHPIIERLHGTDA